MPADINDLIGKQFECGARGPEKYDCHGLAIEVFKRYNIPFPDMDIVGMAAAEVNNALNDEIANHVRVLKDWERIDKPIAPCLVVLKGHFQFANHFGVYLGDGKFVHATETKHGGHVCVNMLNQGIWRNRIAGYYRYTGKSDH